MEDIYPLIYQFSCGNMKLIFSYVNKRFNQMFNTDTGPIKATPSLEYACDIGSYELYAWFKYRLIVSQNPYIYIKPIINGKNHKITEDYVNFVTASDDNIILRTLNEIKGYETLMYLYDINHLCACFVNVAKSNDNLRSILSNNYIHALIKIFIFYGELDYVKLCYSYLTENQWLVSYINYTRLHNQLHILKWLLKKLNINDH
jgi:hypothetical protein